MGKNSTLPSAIEALRGGLVVSCQAPEGSPLRDTYVIAKLAEASLMGGAAGLRINGVEDIEAIRKLTDSPIIGLYKVNGERRPVITPDLEKAAALVQAGADIVALDLSEELHGDDLSLINQVQEHLRIPVMADISTLDEGLRAWEAGADVIGTTLSGYTPESKPAPEEPNLELVRALSSRGIPVIAEGRYRTPEHVAAAFEAGSLAVVVGGAITDALKTTELFAASTPLGHN